MPRISLPWANKTYSGRTRVASLERAVNLFPEANPTITSNQKGATTFVLIGSPGNRPFLDLPDTSEVVHLYSANKNLLAWTRKGVYLIDPEKERIKTIFKGAIGRTVSAAHGNNFADDGSRQLFVWWTDDINGYIANLTTGVVNPLSNDSDFLPATTTTFLDGYAVFSRRNTDEFFWSNILAYDDFNALDFATAEGFPDKLTHIVSFERELWLIGCDTTEIWQNTGNQDNPFQRIGNAFIEMGSPYKDTVVKLTRDIYMVGYDLKVYRSAAKSYRLERVSTHQGLEHDLNKHGADNAVAFGYTMEGHDFYWIMLPEADRTWVYDEATNQWHERSSLIGRLPKECGDGCGGKTYGRHFINYGITHLGITYTGGKGHIYKMDLDYHKDGDERIMREAVSGPLDLGFDEMQINSVELDFQNSCNGVIDECDYGMDGVMLSWSDDQGKTWCDAAAKPLFSNSRGYRPLWNALGSGKSRSLRWRTFADEQIVFRRSNMELEGAGRGS